ncbi:DUF1707 domain-containing protein [Streptomyces sp. NPDC052101]|uniref:DUF1707 SHOCT-like domain-containing protein n=1 Tax=Streptomyces sp. NPDC052101 TaxID=3155763 RepID=UPI00342E77BD
MPNESESKALDLRKSESKALDLRESEPRPVDLRASHDDRERVIEILRTAAGDGRIDLDELDERLEIAFGARTMGELAVLVADLPQTAAVPAVRTAEAPALRTAGAPATGDVVRIEYEHGSPERVGPWRAASRIEVTGEHGTCTLDFRQAVLPGSDIVIDVDLRHGTLQLIVPPGTVVEPSDLDCEHSEFDDRRARQAHAGALRLVVTGLLAHSRVRVKRASQ